MSTDINKWETIKLHENIEGQVQYGCQMNILNEIIPYNCDPKGKSDSTLLALLNTELTKFNIVLNKSDIICFDCNQKAYLKDG